MSTRAGSWPNSIATSRTRLACSGRVVARRIADAGIIEDFGFAAESFGLQGNQRFNPLADQFPRALGAGANPDVQARVPGNDGGERPGLKRADRDDGRIKGINIARHNGLQRHDNSRCGYNGIRRHVGQRPVAAQALNRHFNNINGRRNGPGPHGNLPRFVARNIMQRKDRIAGKALEQPLLNHALGPADVFFGGLKNQMHRAIEILRLRQVARRPSSMVVWPSWPQACILPAVREA